METYVHFSCLFIVTHKIFIGETEVFGKHFREEQNVHFMFCKFYTS
jgi:hypothetical protein